MINVNVATKYDVEFEVYPVPVTDFLEFIQEIRGDDRYCDTVLWHNEDDTAFELDVALLRDFQLNECQEVSAYFKYVDQLIKMAPEGATFVRVELY